MAPKNQKLESFLELVRYQHGEQSRFMKMQHAHMEAALTDLLEEPMGRLPAIAEDHTSAQSFASGARRGSSCFQGPCRIVLGEMPEMAEAQRLTVGSDDSWTLNLNRASPTSPASPNSISPTDGTTTIEEPHLSAAVHMLSNGSRREREPTSRVSYALDVMDSTDATRSRQDSEELVPGPCEPEVEVIYRQSDEKDEETPHQTWSSKNAERLRDGSRRSLDSMIQEIPSQFSALRRYGNLVAFLCVLLNVLVLVCELEFTGLAAGQLASREGNYPGMVDQWLGDAETLLTYARICRDVDLCFCVVFLVEVALRLAVERREFIKSLANIYDTILAIVGLVDLLVFLSHVNAHDESTGDALLQGLKAFRAIRILRYLRFIEGIRLLFKACQAFLPSLFWSMVLLVVFMCVGALIISHLLQGFISDSSQDLDDRIWIWIHYGTAYRSLYTIFELTFAGNWPTYVRPVIENVSHSFVIFFVTYITMIAFALIRVITAVILKDTLEAAQNDAEHQVQERLQKKAEYIQKLEQVFMKLDDGGDGLITEERLIDMLEDPKVKAYFQTLDVDVHEGTALFHILDNGDGEVTLDEFINGILRCKGNARAIDQLAMHSDLRQLTKKLLQLEQNLNLPDFTKSQSIPRSRLSIQDGHLKAFRQMSDGESFTRQGTPAAPKMASS